MLSLAKTFLRFHPWLINKSPGDSMLSQNLEVDSLPTYVADGTRQAIEVRTLPLSQHAILNFTCWTAYVVKHILDRIMSANR